MEAQVINYAKIAAYIGSAFVMGIGSIGPALGQGMIAARAVENMGKYPESANKIRTTMFLALGIVETSAIYAFVVAMMLILFT
jgi:F-type H+-transporting ATPase subunit c